MVSLQETLVKKEKESPNKKESLLLHMLATMDI